MVVRQAIVVVHGMGEQLPGQTIGPFSKMVRAHGMEYYPRPTLVGDSLEARYHRVPQVNSKGQPNGNLGADTDIYEYHWSYRMKENRLKDLGAVAHRTLLPTNGWLHLLGVVVGLVMVVALAAIVSGAWEPVGMEDQSERLRRSLLFPGEWAQLTLWPWNAIDWRLVLAALGLAVVGGALTASVYWWIKRRVQVPAKPSPGLVFLATTVWTTVVGILLLTLLPLTVGGLLAIVLFAIVLSSMLGYTPNGLKVTWVMVWVAIAGLVYGLVLSQWEELLAATSEPETIPKVIVGGAGVFFVGLVLGRVAPWLTTSFVDVVRYVDTSPRSYEVRRDIRQGLVDMLGELHEQPPGRQYDRIVVIAHSLGSYIAYDAISTLWFRRTKDAVVDVPLAAEDAFDRELYREQQRSAFDEIAAQYLGSYPLWRISELLTYGSPMCMAHRLVTKTLKEFSDRRDNREFLMCPPPNDAPGITEDAPSNLQERQEIAAFGVVRWTNLWYATGIGLFGDPFGGRLVPLFGKGIRDERIRDGVRSWIPYAAHAWYTKSKRLSGRTTFANVVDEIIRIPGGEVQADPPD